VVKIRIKGNQILEVTPMSGPREYYRLVQTAVRRLSCSAGGAEEAEATLPIEFKEE